MFLSRFRVSKWHPKILQWHPKFWKPRHGFALYWSKKNWDKHVFLHVAIATDGCNVIDRRFGICAFSCAPLRFGLLLYRRRFVQYGVRNCESTLMQLWKCFTVSALRSACLAMHQTTMKTKGWQLQRACKTSLLSSEATVRARSEILAIWAAAALKQLTEDKKMQCALFYCNLSKQKFSAWCLPFVNIGTSPNRTEQNVSGGMFWLWTDKSFRRTVHR